MPPKDLDITRTGLQDWRTIKAQNDDRFDEDYLKRREQARRYRESIKTSSGNFGKTAAQNPEMFTTGSPVQANPEYGKSRYDAPDATLDQYLNTQDYRGTYQSGAEQLLNGVLKGAITTGTTFVNTLAGIPIGMLEATAQGDISKLWDNEITNLMSNIDDWAEKELPNYYTREELDSPWYTNVFTANFLGDKLIKNFGFTFGAGAAGKVISKVPKLLPKMITKAAVTAGKVEKDVAAIGRAANAFSTSFVSAVGEGSIEALNATKEWSAAMTNQINQEQAVKLQALQQEYEANLNAILQQYGNTEIGQAMVMSYQQEIQQKAQAIENETNQKMAQVASQRAQLGNAVLGFNLPILTLGNLLTLGKVYAKGYTAEMSSIDRHIKFHPEDLANAGKTVPVKNILGKTKDVVKQAFTNDITLGKNVTKAVANAGWEGVEEMLQAWASNAGKSYNTDYYNQSVDPDYTDKTANMWKSLGDSFIDTFGNIDNWEEFAIGMLSGGMSNIILGQTGEMRRERLAVNQAVEQLNNAVNTFDNREMIKGINRHQYLEDLKTHAAIENREKEYKDADFAQLASDVVLFGSLGKLDELKAIVDYNLENLSDDELETLSSALSQQENGGPENNLFVKLDTQGKRQYLKDQQQKYHQVIDDYNNERNELTALTGNLFSQEQMSELVYERLRAKNASKRAEEVKQQLKEELDNAVKEESSNRDYHASRLNLHQNILSGMRQQLTKWNRELVQLRDEEKQLRSKISTTREYAVRNKSTVERDLDTAYENLYAADAATEQLKGKRSTTYKSRNQRQLEASQKRITQLEKQINRYASILNEYEEGTGSKQRTRLDNLGKIYFEQIDTTTKTGNLRGRAREEQAQIKLLQKLLRLDDFNIEGYNTALEFIAKNLDTIFDINSKALYAGNVREAYMSTFGLGIILSQISTDAVTSQKLLTGVTDITTLLADALNYNNRVSEFLQNPQKLEEKNNGIRERILNKRLDKEANKVEENIANTEDFNEFSRKLNNLDARVKAKVLQRLKDKQNKNAQEYDEKNRIIDLVLNYINKSDAEPRIKQIAINRFNNAISTLSVENLTNIDSNIYSREANQQLDDDTYVKVKTLLAEAFKFQADETSEPIQEDTLNLDDIPATEEKSEKEQSSEKSMEDWLAGIYEENEEFNKQIEQLNSNNNAPEEETAPVEVVEVIAPSEQTFNKVENAVPVSLVNVKDGTNNLTEKEVSVDEKIVLNESNNQPVTKPDTKNNDDVMGMQKVDTKSGSNNFGKPVIEEVDEQTGELTQQAKNSKLLYDKLKELGAFDNVDNGVVQVGSKVYFGLIPSLDKTIKEQNNYDGTTILLFVDGKCVGHLAPRSKSHTKLVQLLKDEFNGKLDTTDVLVSKKYYTIADDIWSGIVLYNKSYKTLTSDDLAWTRNRLNSSVTSQDDRTPLFTIFDGSTGFRKDSEHIFRYGDKVAPVYMDNPLYKGSPVLLIPTGAYDRNKPNTQQNPKAFIPVALRRVLFDDSANTTTNRDINETISSLFRPNLTVKQLNETVGKLKSNLTYEFNTAEGKQQVFIVPARQVVRENTPTIVEMTPNMFASIADKNRTAQDIFENGAYVTHLIIQRKVNGKTISTYTVGIAQGTFHLTQALPQEMQDNNKAALIDFFKNEAKAYYNIDQNRLNNPDYIQQILDDELLQTNAKELKVEGNSFHMNGEILTDNGTKQETKQPENTEQVVEQPTGERSEPIKQFIALYTGGKQYVNIDAPGLEAWEQLKHLGVTTTDIYNIQNEVSGKLLDYFARAYEYATKQPLKVTIPTTQEQSKTSETVSNPLLDLLGDNFDSTRQVDTEGQEKYSRVTPETNLGTINTEKEINNILKVLPQLSREEAFEIIEYLKTINDKGEQAQGIFNAGLITLSKLAEAGTGYHEAFHLVFNMILSEEERNNLLAEYKAKNPKLDNLELEEQMADDFKEFALLNENNISTTNWIQRIGQKIYDVFKNIANLLHLYRHQPLTFNKVCSDIWQSKYAYKTLNPTDAYRPSTAIVTKISQANLTKQDYKELNTLAQNINKLYRRGRKAGSFAVQFRTKGNETGFFLTDNSEQRYINGKPEIIYNTKISKEFVEKYLKDNNLTDRYELNTNDRGDTKIMIKPKVALDETNGEISDYTRYQTLVNMQRQGYTLSAEEDYELATYPNKFDTEKNCG